MIDLSLVTPAHESFRTREDKSPIFPGFLGPGFLGPDFNELWGFSGGAPVQKTRNNEVAGSVWTGSSGSKTFGCFFPESVYYKYICVRWASTENQVEKLYITAAMLCRL